MTTIEALDDAEAVEVPDGKNLLARLDQTGDTKLIWDPSIPSDVATARAAWDAGKKAGCAFYDVSKQGEAGTLITNREFDPERRRVIMRPPMVGG